MKQSLTYILFLFPAILYTQAVDSETIRQVDSLIQVSRDLASKKDYARALDVNAVAEKIARDILGPESAAYGTTCYNHGRILHINRDYYEAESWYLKSIIIREKNQGKEPLDYASSLYYQALLYSDMSEFDKAESIYLKAKDISIKTLGKEHRIYSAILYSLIDLYKKTGQFEKAEPTYLESVEILGKTLGKKHPDYARSLYNLANLYKDKGQYEKAKPLYLEAKDIIEGTLGKQYSDYTSILTNLANLYKDMGLYDEAEPLCLEAIEIGEQTLGKKHPDYARSLNNLANLYLKMGQYEKAEPLYLDALAITEQTLGKRHPDYARSLYALATLYYYKGQYEKSETLHLEARDIREQTLGKEHPDYANSLNALATLYYDMGQYDKAELLHLEAKDIRGKTLGKEHPYYASTLTNLASMYDNSGQYEKAEPLYLEAKDINEKTLGKEHPNYAISLNNLASLYYHTRQYDKAEPLFLEAIDITGKNLGHEHPFYSGTLNSLASLYHDMGQFDKSERLFLEAKDINEKTLGKGHPDYANSLNNLAVLYRNTGQYDKAASLFLELSTANKHLIERAIHHLSELELSNYLKSFSNHQDQILTLTKASNSKKLIASCYDNSLFYKGFLLQAANRMKQLVMIDEGSIQKYNQLKGYQQRLARLYTQPIAGFDSALITELENKSNKIEKDLARTVSGWAEANRQVQWQEVQASLQAEEAAVEFVHFRNYDKSKTLSIMYAALVLRPDMEQPHFIPLFEERQLDNLLQSQGSIKADNVNAIYSVAARGIKPVGEPVKSIFEPIWQPLIQELGNVKKVYFSSSGLLHRLNLGAIPISNDETLGDRYQLKCLSSTRQLVVPTKVETVAQNAILFGGINYEMDKTAIAIANKNYDSDATATREYLSFSYAKSTTRGETWGYLKWTDKEVDNVETTLQKAGFQTDTRKGYSATEESFKAIGHNGKSPRILHLATHGFFFPDPVQKSREQFAMSNDDPVFKISEHPMIRSGLILAGGNYAWKTGKPVQPGMEDGILTAYEISQVNLSNTELVVLSACETGLGDIHGNEGVYGLQRAFKIAGVKYLIMSLWQIPDFQTQELMTTFYSKWLENKMTIPDAFNSAQQEMRDKYQNPFFWAGFVLVE
ncbi:MAG: CHAT domain-containing tetratricopeptide repeat protein [Saprospiraceae bacterium]